jgi:hypothetical protein
MGAEVIMAEKGTVQPLNPIATLAALEAVQAQLQHLVETIARLVRLQRSLPAGSARNQLLEEISCLDVIAEVMKNCLIHTASLLTTN